MNATQQIDVHIRWMIRADMADVQHIEEVSFDYPWCEDDFLNALRLRNCIGQVAEVRDEVVGFFLFELKKTKLHLMNFAVHPAFRRRGVGRQMVQNLTRKLSIGRRAEITLEVRDTNLPAQLFFRAQHFRATKILPRYYDDSGEDAYRMQFRIGADAEAIVTPTNRLTQFGAP